MVLRVDLKDSLNTINSDQVAQSILSSCAILGGGQNGKVFYQQPLCDAKHKFLVFRRVVGSL